MEHGLYEYRVTLYVYRLVIQEAYVTGSMNFGAYQDNPGNLGGLNNC
jgi:hypothetical protein